MSVNSDDLIPRRTGLVEQTATILRRRLAAGEWAARLPSERELCRAMQIARNTLRAALAQLEREGRVRPGHRGMPRRAASGARAANGVPARTVVFLTPERIESLQPATLLQIDILAEHLHDAKLSLRVETSRAYHVGEPGGALTALCATHPGAVWVLHRSTHAMQSWFDRSGERAVILGCAYPDVRLSYVSEDLAAAAVHAASRLIALGHRRIRLLRPLGELAGHRVIHNALADYLRRHLGVPVHRVGAAHDDTVAGLCDTLDLLFRREHPPTALLTVTSGALVTALTHLGRRGWRVPDDVSLVHFFDDPILDRLVPSVAHYHVNPQTLMKRLLAVIIRLAGGASAGVRPSRVMCQFVAGGSLAAARTGPVRVGGS